MFRIFRPLRAAEMEGAHKSAPNLSILQCPLLFRRPFPRPLGFSGFPAVGDRSRFRILGFLGIRILGFFGA